MGNGGSAHRVQGRSGYVDHGHHAAFDRKTFLDLGGYDEKFSHNEDAEFDARLKNFGKRIYLDSAATVTYFPRADLASLARQYFKHGAGRASTFLKHYTVPKLRQILPVAVFLGCALSLALSLLDVRYLVFPIIYALSCITWGVGLAIRRHEICLAMSGIAAVVMHMSWGCGFLARLLRAASSG
jgi:succinoglycan biosynthesis protein ExoA